MSERWNIIAKLVTKEELTTAEKELLETSSEEFNTDYNVATSTQNKIDLYFQLKQFDTNRAWNKVNQQLNSKKQVRFTPVLLRIAAVFLLLVATSVLIWQVSKKEEQMVYTTLAGDSSHPEITLHDGTIVTLNQGSELKAPKLFKGNTREVELSGEAFFQVAKNAEKPFIINTGKVSVKVLGTSFNVNAYKDEALVEVMVKTGKVLFFENNTNNKNGGVLLLPGEQGLYSTASNTLEKSSQPNTNAFSWLTHEIKFELTSLNEVFSTLEHHYHIKINLDKSIDLNQPYNATFNKQEIDYILEVLAMTFDLKVIKNSYNNYSLMKTN